MTISQDIATYAVLAMQAYDFMDEDEYSFDEISKTFSLSDPAFRGWRAVNSSDAGTLQLARDGFNAEIFQNGADYVISLRGTDDWETAGDRLANANFITGSISAQLQHAVAYVEKILDTVPGITLDQITFVGHSLGGGLASALAALYDRPAQGPAGGGDSLSHRIPGLDEWQDPVGPRRVRAGGGAEAVACQIASRFGRPSHGVRTACRRKRQ